MASDAAERMAQKVYEKKIANALAELSALADELAKKHIPAPVIACTREYPNYIENSRSVYLCNGRKDSIPSVISFAVPYASRFIYISDDEYKGVDTCFEKCCGLKDDRLKFYKKVESSLLSLCTAKRVAENFPEAMDYLDFPQEKQLPALALNELRQIVAAIK